MKILFGKHKGKEYSEIPSDYIAWLLAEDVIKGSSRESLIEFLIKEKHEELLQAWIDKNYVKRKKSSPTKSHSSSSARTNYASTGYSHDDCCPISTGDRDFMGTGGSCDWLLDATDFPEPF